ncbi:MAG: heparan N-sulfatase, partial [Planctomycetaceae bacterium]
SRPAFRNGPNGEPPRRRGPARPVTFHGRSFLATLDQPQAKGFDEIFASHTFHEITMYYPMRVVISGHYKYIFNIAHQLPYPFASDLYASPTWQGVLKRGDTLYGKRTVYSYLHRPRHELYDLQTDPDEITNLAYEPAHRDRLKSLQNKLKAWQQETRDPWFLKWKYE